jgi:DNA repair photolyase
MIKNIKAKTLLSSIKEGIDEYFGIRYSMNLYRGCQFGCIYCDSRSTCYGIENFSDILIKENALELLEKELRSKRKKGTIGTGSMNDPYMPVEKKMELTRGALKLMRKYRFPVHIITKGDLVVRDVDLLKEISKIYAAVSFTITASDDNLAKQIEPHAPSSSSRFEAIKKLSSEGIYTGVVLTPILPFITDTKENIEEIIVRAKESGAQYILCWMGMTMREGQREYFYNELDKRFPGLKEKYIKRYRSNYSCPVPAHYELNETFMEVCRKEKMETKMKFFKDSKPEQISLFQS